MSLNRAAMAADYQNKFDTMKVSRTAAVEAAARRIASGWGRYLVVEKMTGVPAAFIGVCHDREASCDFRGCLHNGDHCIGNGRLTSHVPKGLGPFPTWEASAVHCLRRQGFLGQSDWSMGMLIVRAEELNGEGYHNHGFENPYLWGGTQFYHRGKYVEDHVYSSTFVDPQVGIAPTIKRVLELTHATIPAKPWVAPAPANDNPAKPKLAPVDKKAVVQNSRALRWGEYYTNFCHYLGLSWGTLLTTVQSLQPFLTDWRTLTVLGVLGGGYLASLAIRFNLLGAAAAGRYTPSGFFKLTLDPNYIPAADGDNSNPASPPAPADGPLAPDTVAVPSAPADDVQGAVPLQEAA